MPRAIDFHVHLPISEFMDVAIGRFREATERYFRSEVKLHDIEEIAAYYTEQDMVGVIVAWDAETATGRSRCATIQIGPYPQHPQRPELAACARRADAQRPAAALAAHPHMHHVQTSPAAAPHVVARQSR